MNIHEIMTTTLQDDFDFTTLISWGSAAAMMFGGVVPYIPQYMEIQQTENADGFSLFVCLALLIANTLRILFWFGHPFELPLLIQSIFMNITMMVLVHLCVRIRNKNVIIRSKNHQFFASTGEGQDYARSTELSPRNAPTPRVFWDFDSQYFWAWTDFFSYVEFMATFTAVVGMAIFLLLENYWFVEAVGFLAVFVEAMLGAPQFLRNYESQSTEGMSKKMVIMWLSGDVFKTVYFVVRNSPIQFWLCGLLQVSIDIAILIQVFIYWTRSSSKGKPSTYIS